MEYNYGFLFKKSSLSKARLTTLLHHEDFILKANEVMDKGNGLEDLDIYNIVKMIYFPMLKDFQTDGFKEDYKNKYGNEAYHEWSARYRIFGQATKKFSEDLFGNKSYWEKEFEDYKQSTPNC